MMKTFKPYTIAFFSFFIRLVPACLFVILAFYFISPFFIKAHLKLFKNEIEFLHPEYEVLSYDVITINQFDYIEFLVQVNKDPDIIGGSVKKGSDIRLKAQASTLCIAPIIIFSLILAWPGTSLKQKIKAMLIAIPLILLLAGLDYPILLIADIESAYSNDVVLNSIRQFWKDVMNNGGRQFFAIIIFLFAIAMTYPKKQQTIHDKVGRNSPCPCGSGEKYKNCCLP